MKQIQHSLLLLLPLLACLLFVQSCKEKNEEFPPRSWSEYNYTGSGVEARDISVIYFENDHSLWLGAKGSEGLLYHDGYEWNVLDTENTGINFDSITSIIRDGNGKLWIGWRYGLANYDGTNWHEISELSGLRVTSIAVEGIAKIRVGIKGISGGLATYDGYTWQFQTLTNSEIPSGNINALASDHDQVLWLATEDKGIIRLKNEKWEVISSGLPLVSENISSIVTAPDNSIWAGSEQSQLIHFYTDTFTILNTGTSKPISSMAITEDGSVWCSTLGAGLIKFDGNNWTSFTHANSALPSDEILYLTQGNPGYLIFSTSRGTLNYIKQ